MAKQVGEVVNWQHIMSATGPAKKGRACFASSRATLGVLSGHRSQSPSTPCAGHLWNTCVLASCTTTGGNGVLDVAPFVKHHCTAGQQVLRLDPFGQCTGCSNHNRESELCIDVLRICWAGLLHRKWHFGVLRGVENAVDMNVGNHAHKQWGGCSYKHGSRSATLAIKTKQKLQAQQQCTIAQSIQRDRSFNTLIYRRENQACRIHPPCSPRSLSCRMLSCCQCQLSESLRWYTECSLLLFLWHVR
jgi:hypothetical protein